MICLNCRPPNTEGLSSAQWNGEIELCAFHSTVDDWKARAERAEAKIDIYRKQLALADSDLKLRCDIADGLAGACDNAVKRIERLEEALRWIATVNKDIDLRKLDAKTLLGLTYELRARAENALAEGNDG